MTEDVSPGVATRGAVDPVPGDLGPVVAALDTIVDLGRDRLAQLHLDAAADLLARCHERASTGAGYTVVVVAGGTGVGKSALVNRLVGSPIAREGVRRPTTSRPLAILRPPIDPARPLLDWLAIDDRREADGALPDGLVLVDLPDHDSVIEDHRTTSTRLAARADAVLVVVDPIKYARADLHDGPLAELTAHAEVVTVVLNRVDELAPDDADRCLADLRQRLTTSGHGEVTVVTTSAATGTGVAQVGAWLRELAEERLAATRRLVADAAALARHLQDDLPALPDPVVATDAFREAIMEATDAHRAGLEAEVAYRRDARRGCRSPASRVASRVSRRITGGVVDLGLGSPASPTSTSASSVGRIQATLAAELELSRTAGPAHVALGETIEQLAVRGAPALADAVDGAGIRPGRRWWWPFVSGVRGVVDLVTVVGLVWLVTLAIAEWLQLPEIPVPTVTGALTWPTSLFVGGVVIRVIVGVATRLAIGRGARRHHAATDRAIRRRLDAAVHERLLAPYEAELARHHTLRDAVSTLARDA